MTIFVQSAGAGGAEQEVRFDLGLVDGASDFVLPAGARVTDAELDVTTPYSPGTTVTIGRASSPALLQGAGDNDPEVEALYGRHQDTAWGTAAAVVATVAGAPAVGASAVIVRFTMPVA